MKISQRLRFAATVDLKHLVPKQKFKGWKTISWKPNLAILDKPDKKVSIHLDLRSGDLVYYIVHPKAWGNIAHNGLEGTYSSSGDELFFKGKIDPEEWDEFKGFLEDLLLVLINKAA